MSFSPKLATYRNVLFFNNSFSSLMDLQENLLELESLFNVSCLPFGFVQLVREAGNFPFIIFCSGLLWLTGAKN